MEFDKKLNFYISYFNDKLEEFLNSYSKNCLPELAEMIKYSVIDGGKRVRPTLCLATAETLGIPLEKVVPLCLANEFIHAYSLVHDDLPCMDNDDYRRGKLSTHKKFGEELGVLCGDALLNLAIEVALSGECNENYINAVKLLFDYAGAKGMILGQVLDLKNEKNSNPTKEDLENIYINKTSKLLTAPLLMASSLANRVYFDKLKEYGFLLGFMFQITDDFLDYKGDFSIIGKTPNKDEKADKLTAIKVYGVDKALSLLDECYFKCIDLLKTIPNSDFLIEFTKKIYKRNK